MARLGPLNVVGVAQIVSIVMSAFTLETPLLRTSGRGATPSRQVAGDPARVAVPLPLSVKVKPDGSGTGVRLEMDGVGDPAVVIKNDFGTPYRNETNEG